MSADVARLAQSLGAVSPGCIRPVITVEELVELELRAIRTCNIRSREPARENLLRAPFDIGLKSAFSWVHHTHLPMID